MSTNLAYQKPYPILDPEKMKGRDNKAFIADDDLLAAANVALALGRPLLLTGEPGCGKTDFAFAAASGLVDAATRDHQPREVLSYYVRTETRARDLLYHYDAVRRFSDSQAGGEQGKRRATYPQNYIHLEALGIGLTAPQRQVVLIDEIDKAPRDLPNDLLRELDQGRFEIPEIPRDQVVEDGALDSGQEGLARRMAPPKGAPKPFVIITSNVERQLPDAFLRRCVFFYIQFPDDTRLTAILDAHFPDASTLLKAHAQTLFSELRRDSLRLTKKPATAELLNWVEAMRHVFDPTETEGRLAELVAQKESRGIEWKALPALGCLLKLREDLETVGAM